jgi:hypothetical protein|tara:strand:+ start:290 stop:703 length:414 start_codon:yes stop_codon:yes gene_type:complete
MKTTKEKNKYVKNWREDNRDKIQSYIANKKEEYTDIQSTHYKRMMIARARTRAIKNNIPFDLTIDNIVIPNICPILGIELKSGTGKGAKDHSPAMDRITPSLGYVEGNIQVISSRANRIKNDSTIEELAMILEYLKS